MYQSAKNKDHFWQEVSKLLQEKKHYFTGPSCERRFKDGIKLYKNEVARRARTGEPADELNQKGKETWYWSEAMHHMMKDNPSVHPRVTISCGSSSARRVKGESDTDEDDPDDPVVENSSALRIGKSRIPFLQLKRPQSKADKKIDAVKAVALAMDRRNDLYEIYIKSKQKPNSNDQQNSSPHTKTDNKC